MDQTSYVKICTKVYVACSWQNPTTEATSKAGTEAKAVGLSPWDSHCGSHLDLVSMQQRRESLATLAQKPLPHFQSIANLGCACLQNCGHQQRLMTSRFQEMFFKALQK